MSNKVFDLENLAKKSVQQNSSKILSGNKNDQMI